MTEAMQAVDPPQTNGIDSMDDDERAKIRPVDIDADVKEMERRKRVEHIMNSKMFREELERIIETQLNEGTGTNSLMQQISDMMGVNKAGGNFYKNSSCVLPINDIRGIEAMGYGKGEKILRCKLAAVYRLIDLCGWNQGTASLITARLNQDEEHFLVNPYGMLYHEITASSLIKVDMQANIVEQGTTNFSLNISAFSLHGAIHAARPDIKCIIHIHTPSVVAVSSTKAGLLPISQESVVIGEVSTHPFLGGLIDPEEKDKLARNLGPNNKVLLLTNQGVLCCGETIEEAFFNARNTVLACETQLKLLPIGLDNIILLNEETRKRIYEAAHKAPESTPRPDKPTILEGKVERKWRVGGVEFEGLMRMLDNVGFRTGYIYRHPLVKGDIPRPKNDVEVPPAVSSLGYLLEEEELYKKGLWRNLGDGKKGQNRSRWLNSPNVYQRVEFLETGTQDPKKITKWVADGSPTHSSTPVKIDNALQFVPKNTNPKEFKLKQQQIKDYRRADKISAGPQSYILETLTWEEAKKMQDASLNQSGDQVVLMGAASKGIIQRGHQHNAMVYKSPYAKNPFDSVTDEELDEYKKVVEKKSKGDYDTDFSESELSSAAINKRMDGLHLRSPTSETEEESRDEPQVLRIETKHAPKPSQPEVVLSDGYKILKLEDNTKTTNHFRTNSHFGLPKGSYLVPNPVHYHIAQKKEICKIRKPRLAAFAPFNCSSGYLFNNNNTNRYRSNNAETLVTVKFDASHSVSLNIPLDVMKSFILPFADALNVEHNLPILNTQSCQTAYMNNFQHRKPRLSELQKNYTPLSERENRPHGNVNDVTTSFEAQILIEMKEKMLDMSIDSNTTAKDSSDGNLDILSDLEITDFEIESVINEVLSECELPTEEPEIISVTNETISHWDSPSLDMSRNLTVIENGKTKSHMRKLVETAGHKRVRGNDLFEVHDANLVQLFTENETEKLVTSYSYDRVISDDTICIENVMNEMLYEIEGRVIALPNRDISCPSLSENSISNCTTEATDRVLWRISEESGNTRLSDQSVENNEKNDTFILDEKHDFNDKTFEINNEHQDEEVLDENIDEDVDDEGIGEECETHENKISNPKHEYLEEGIKKLTDAIYDYLRQQCFEIKELVLFPEVLHDTNLNKLLAKLKRAYDESYPNGQTNEKKSELRLTISKNILNYLENDSTFTDSSNDSSLMNIVSDKIFTISEFVSDILDNFFVLVNKSSGIVIREDNNGENFLEFTQPFHDANGNLLHSTPEEIGDDCSKSPDNVSTPIVTSFKKDRSKKSGTETFWITCYGSPSEFVTSPKSKRIFNIDDIPLRPPDDLLNKSGEKNNLYTIPEEPRRNLFGTSSNNEFEKLHSSQTLTENHLDILAGGDASNISETEKSVLLLNEAQFFRFHSVSSSMYVKADCITVQRNETKHDESYHSVVENLECSDEEGNWMGYNMAQF